jgi:hypothetical protein
MVSFMHIMKKSLLSECWRILTNSPLFVQQIWALASGRKTEMLATGGTDSVLTLWHDCTMEDKQEDFRKKASETFCHVFGLYLCQ